MAWRPLVHGEDCRQLPWDTAAGNFVFIVDCKPVADILSGRALLQLAELQPVYERMTANICRLLGSGWEPHQLIGDPVVWERRENNCIADYIVNHTMDRREDWTQVFDAINENIWSGNLICHSDGGRRDESCAGAAWFLESRTVNCGAPVCSPRAMRGIFIASPTSSFIAESLALDDAISYVCRLIL